MTTTISSARQHIHGAGIGLRSQLFAALQETPTDAPQPDFLEIAPENWLARGGKRPKTWAYFRERYPFVCHGLSLSLGAPAPLDENFILQVKQFLDDNGIEIYTEHLSYCGDEGHLHDLLPIPFTEEAVHYVAKRIRRTQDLLERRIGIENVSSYCAPGKEMEETDFINAVLAEADCDLMLDVNNIYVNSVNHGFDASEFLSALQPKGIAYIHMAGHAQKQPDLIIDSHGADIIDPVWALLKQAYTRFGNVPTIIERDFNIPPLAELMKEVTQVKALQAQMAGTATSTTQQPAESVYV